MKKVISTIMCLSLILCLSGCVSQKEADALHNRVLELEENLSNAQEQITKLEKNLSDANNKIGSLEVDKNALNADLENTKQQLESANQALTDAQKTIAALEGEIDELKNGPDRMLAAVRNAYNAKDWKQTISLASTLHAKYPGMNQDIEAQSLAATAQKTLDDEKAKAEAEAAKTMKEKVHGLIRITKLSCSKPNSAGGVGINLHFVNKHPEKTIKYLYVTVYPYNAVGDMMDCDIRGYSWYTCEATGPYAPGKGINASTGWWWPNAWYNWNISYIELSGVRIVYTDGTSVTLTSKELEYAIW